MVPALWQALKVVVEAVASAVLEHFSKAFAWLGSQPDLVAAGDYALVGGSRGAEAGAERPRT